MNLTIKQYQKAEQEEARLSSPDKTKRRTIANGDSLWLIARRIWRSGKVESDC